MKIPVLGVPVLNHYDFLETMLASVNVEVERYIIVDNGGTYATNAMWTNVIQPGTNLGVAASWNSIIKASPSAPWWCIVSNDLIFAEDDLPKLVNHFESHANIAMLFDFAAFGIHRETVSRVGWFDENFHPAYCEDNDYVRRCGLLGTEVTAIPAGYTHYRSSTIQSDERWARENMRTFPQNQGYYYLKWGGPPTEEEFTTPFNGGGSPREWSLDIARLSALTWKKE